MTEKYPIVLKRDCPAVLIPSGETLTLSAGSRVWLTQALGAGYTVMTDQGYMARVDGADADAFGSLEPRQTLGPAVAGDAVAGASIEEAVWNQLRSCFDPEIPVNIVDLGLVYGCRVEALATGGHRVHVQFTLTAQGCGMGQFLKEDIKKKLLALSEVHEAEVELVWEPPWNQSMISASAKQQLGME